MKVKKNKINFFICKKQKKLMMQNYKLMILTLHSQLVETLSMIVIIHLHLTMMKTMITVLIIGNSAFKLKQEKVKGDKLITKLPEIKIKEAISSTLLLLAEAHIIKLKKVKNPKKMMEKFLDNNIILKYLLIPHNQLVYEVCRLILKLKFFHSLHNKNVCRILTKSFNVFLKYHFLELREE